MIFLFKLIILILNGELMITFLYMYSFVYPFFSDKNNGLLYIFTLHTFHVKANLLCVLNVYSLLKKKKSNVILVMFFCNNFYTLVFLSFNLSSSFLFLISYFPFFFSHRDKLFSNT